MRRRFSLRVILTLGFGPRSRFKFPALMVSSGPCALGEDFIIIEYWRLPGIYSSPFHLASSLGPSALGEDFAIIEYWRLSGIYPSPFHLASSLVCTFALLPRYLLLLLFNIVANFANLPRHSSPMEPTGEVMRDLPGSSNQEAQPSSSAAPVDGASSRDDDSSSSSGSREDYPFRITYRDDKSDSLADGAYSWVDPEVLRVSSVLVKSDSLLGMASAICRPKTWSVTATSCRSGEAVCMNSAEGPRPFFYLYDTLHSRLRIQLPFTHFERSVLRALNVAPTQLHPNSWAFVRAFELLCEDLGKAPSLGVFFWFFGSRKTDRVGWTSLSNRPKRSLLRPFSESYKGFKDRFFRVAPQNPNSRLLVDREGRQHFPLQWTRRPAVSISVVVKSLEGWERAFIDELRELPIYRSSDIIKGEGYSTKALAELWKRKRNQVQPMPPTGLEAEAAPLAAAGPADNAQISQEEASRTPSVFEVDAGAPPSPIHRAEEVDDRPSKRFHVDDDREDDVSASLEVSVPQIPNPRPQLYKSFLQVADRTIASSTVEAEVDRMGLAGVYDAIQQYNAYGFALARVAEKKFGDIFAERSSWEDQRRSLNDENQKLSSALADSEARLLDYGLSTAKLQEALRAEQKMSGELLDLKAELLQAKTELELGNDTLQAEMKKLREEAAEKESTLRDELRSMEESLKIAQDIVAVRDQTIYQQGIDIADQYVVGFQRALSQVEFLHPSVDISEADPFKEVQDGRLVSVLTPPGSPAP
ncbi:hypothetical protein CR513_61506, partial [Mucuna pruriens]